MGQYSFYISSSHNIFSLSRNVFSPSRMSFPRVECLFVYPQCLLHLTFGGCMIKIFMDGRGGGWGGG